LSRIQDKTFFVDGSVIDSTAERIYLMYTDNQKHRYYIRRFIVRERSEKINHKFVIMLDG